MNIQTRKVISLVCAAALFFVIVWRSVTGQEVPNSVDKIVTAMLGVMTFYFGNRTALDPPP